MIPPTVDFDLDGNVDIVDLDALVGNIAMLANDREFDITDDGYVNNQDLMDWLDKAAAHNGFSQPYLVGDANLDGVVDVGDLSARRTDGRDHEHG